MTAPNPGSAHESSTAAASASARTTPDRILDAAEELFAARGLAGTSVRDIASAVQLNPASLYNHFPSKQALYEAVLERGVRPLLEVLEEAAQAESTDPDSIIEAVMAHLAETPQLPRLIYHEALTGGEHLTQLTRRWIQPLLAPALTAAERGTDSAEWEPDEVPLLIAAWLHMIFGHFAMAPMLAELFGTDPLSPDGLARQTEFLRKTSRRWVGGGSKTRD